jgi:hypothetical protein
MKALRQESGGAAHEMAHGYDNAGIQPASRAASAINDRWATWTSSENLASRHPMGRGVIAAAAEAMKKPQG